MHKEAVEAALPLSSRVMPDLSTAPSASDVILTYLREAITTGEFDEGESVRQDYIASRFKVSKIPVREALKRLEAEGLVRFIRNRGAVVTSISEPELAQIFEVRAILESNAIRMSVPHMTTQTFARAEDWCNSFAAESNAANWSTLNWNFHSSLYDDAHQQFLVNLIRGVNDRIERYLRIQLTLTDGIERADREHREILEACRAGDAEGAAELVSRHISAACDSLLAHLRKRRSQTV